MSAFIVDKSHINAMLQGAFNVAQRYRSTFRWRYNGELRELTIENANEIGQMLLDECVKSVSYRYEDSSITDLPGRSDADYLLPFEHSIMARTPKPIELIKITYCYAYQSCEHPEWESSEAKAFCDSLIDYTIPELSGYEEAPWEWHDSSYDTSNKPTRLV